MLERRHMEILDRAPHLAQSLREVLVACGRSVKNPRRLLRGVKRRGKRLWLTRRIRRAWWAIRMRANRGVCSIEIAGTGPGFFAYLTWCLWILRYCEVRGLSPDIRLTSDTYRDPNRGPNWLNDFFDWCPPVSQGEIAKLIRSTQKVLELEDIEHVIPVHMSLSEGSRILHAYLRPKPGISKIVDDFWQTFAGDGPVLGVHFRGTDKFWEAPRVSWEHCLAVVQTYLKQHDEIKAMFVASDEQEFIEFMTDAVAHVPVYFHEDHYRSCSGDERPVFLADGGGYEKGEDALVNALLLAKCSTLIRTTSTLSAWASLFNPDIEVILLNKPYRDNLWYPESEIMKKPDTEYCLELPR